jgi:hypothetical protein
MWFKKLEALFSTLKNKVKFLVGDFSLFYDKLFLIFKNWGLLGKFLWNCLYYGRGIAFLLGSILYNFIKFLCDTVELIVMDIYDDTLFFFKSPPLLRFVYTVAFFFRTFVIFNSLIFSIVVVYYVIPSYAEGGFDQVFCVLKNLLRYAEVKYNLTLDWKMYRLRLLCDFDSSYVHPYWDYKVGRENAYEVYQSLQEECENLKNIDLCRGYKIQPGESWLVDKYNSFFKMETCTFCSGSGVAKSKVDEFNIICIPWL